MTLLKPPTLNQNGDGGLTVALNALGGHKPTIWHFEEEWRYKLIICPFSIEEISRNLKSVPLAFVNQKDLGFEDYYLSISDEAYSRMEVRLGPLCTESDQIMVEDLIHKYNPSAMLNPSALKGMVR